MLFSVYLIVCRLNIYKTTFISTSKPHIVPIKLLIQQLATIGMISSFCIAIAAIISGHFILLVFALCFLSICAISVIVSKFYRSSLAIHIMLLGLLVGFTLSPFCGIYYLSGILAYPLVITLAIFFLTDPLKRFSYAVFCSIGCLVFIHQTKSATLGLVKYDLVEEGLIILGLLSALFIVGFNYFVVLFRYQAKLEESEKQMHKKNLELNDYIDSNLQLENFAHLASHELKTPLRNILNFSKLLNKKIGQKLSPQEKEMLSILENQAVEMDELIKDLFELSSVTNEPMKAARLELSLLVNNMIKFDFFEHKENIKVNFLPYEIRGNKSYIKEVFKNLISNALKFVPSEKEAEITIDCKEKPEVYQFSVKDNGIGISEDKRDKVFLIFKRLHSRKEYEGTGIGLAICKKIIERHLGKIWIEDNPEGGSVFKFTIAKNLA